MTCSSFDGKETGGKGPNTTTDPDPAIPGEGGAVEVTAILPVYNDRPALVRAIPESARFLEGITPSFELLVAEDGSSDGSPDLVSQAARKDPRIRLLHSDERLGRGRALTRAIREARGEIVCYYDVDLATDLAHLGELIGSIRGGYDIATGSRLMPGSVIVRTGGREFASRGYNFLVRLLLGSRLHDHQCGFKAFKRARVLPLLSEVRDTHWFWDTELLVIAQRQGLRVREFPVRWVQGRGTTVRSRDVWKMGRAVFSLWWRLDVQKD